MQQVTDQLERLAAAGFQPSKTSERELERRASNSKREDEIAWRFWDRMTGIYGHKWRSSYGPEPNEAWTGVLRNLEPSQIKRGLTALLESDEAWPPTAIQFRQMCLGDTSWEHTRQAVPAATVLSRAPVDLGEGRALPPPAGGPETPADFFDEMRGLFPAGRR